MSTANIRMGKRVIVVTMTGLFGADELVRLFQIVCENLPACSLTAVTRVGETSREQRLCRQKCFVDDQIRAVENSYMNS